MNEAQAPITSDCMEVRMKAKVEEEIGDLQKWKRFRKGGRRKVAKVEEKVCALQKWKSFRISGRETLV